MSELDENSDEDYDEEDYYEEVDEPRFELGDEPLRRTLIEDNKSSYFGTILEKVHEYVEDELCGKSRAIVRMHGDSAIETKSNVNISTMT